MTLRFLADENVPATLVAAMRGNEADVAWIPEDAAGASDPDVLARAVAEGRILVTFDKDFGELARRHILSDASGVILIRIPPRPDQEFGASIAGIIKSRLDWAGHCSVIEPGRIRMRPVQISEFP